MSRCMAMNHRRYIAWFRSTSIRVSNGFPSLQRWCTVNFRFPAPQNHIKTEWAFSPTPKSQQLFIVSFGVQDSPNLNNGTDDHIKNQVIAYYEIAVALGGQRQVSGARAAFRHCGQADNPGYSCSIILQWQLVYCTETTALIRPKRRIQSEMDVYYCLSGIMVLS